MQLLLAALQTVIDLLLSPVVLETHSSREPEDAERDDRENGKAS